VSYEPDTIRGVIVFCEGEGQPCDSIQQLHAAAERVVVDFTAWAEDHNDGTYAYWKSDDLMHSIVNLRTLLYVIST